MVSHDSFRLEKGVTAMACVGEGERAVGLEAILMDRSLKCRTEAF